MSEIQEQETSNTDTDTDIDIGVFKGYLTRLKECTDFLVSFCDIIDKYGNTNKLDPIINELQSSLEHIETIRDAAPKVQETIRIYVRRQTNDKNDKRQLNAVNCDKPSTDDNDLDTNHNTDNENNDDDPERTIADDSVIIADDSFDAEEVIDETLSKSGMLATPIPSKGSKKADNENNDDDPKRTVADDSVIIADDSIDGEEEAIDGTLNKSNMLATPIPSKGSKKADNENNDDDPKRTISDDRVVIADDSIDGEEEAIDGTLRKSSVLVTPIPSKGSKKAIITSDNSITECANTIQKEINNSAEDTNSNNTDNKNTKTKDKDSNNDNPIENSKVDPINDNGKKSIAHSSDDTVMNLKDENPIDNSTKDEEGTTKPKSKTTIRLVAIEKLLDPKLKSVTNPSNSSSRNIPRGSIGAKSLNSSSSIIILDSDGELSDNVIVNNNPPLHPKKSVTFSDTVKKDKPITGQPHHVYGNRSKKFTNSNRNKSSPNPVTIGKINSEFLRSCLKNKKLIIRIENCELAESLKKDLDPNAQQQSTIKRKSNNHNHSAANGDANLSSEEDTLEDKHWRKRLKSSELSPSPSPCGRKESNKRKSIKMSKHKMEGKMLNDTILEISSSSSSLSSDEEFHPSKLNVSRRKKIGLSKKRSFKKEKVKKSRRTQKSDDTDQSDNDEDDEVIIEKIMKYKSKDDKAKRKEDREKKIVNSGSENVSDLDIGKKLKESEKKKVKVSTLEQGNNSTSKKTKELPSEKENHSVLEKEKKSKADTEKNPLSLNSQISPSEKKKNSSSEKEKNSSKRKKISSSEKKKISGSEKEKKPASKKEKESSSEKDKDPASETEKDPASEKEEDRASEKEKDSASEKEKELGSETERELGSETEKEPVSEKEKELVSEKGKEKYADREKCSASSDEEKVSASDEEKVSASDEEKVSASDEEKGSGSDMEKGSVSSKEKNPASEKEKDLVSDIEKDSASEKENDSGSDIEKDSASDKEKGSGSDNEKESASDKEKDSGSDNEKESASDKEKDSGSDNEKVSASDNETDTKLKKIKISKSEKKKMSGPKKKTHSESDNDEKKIKSSISEEGNNSDSGSENEKMDISESENEKASKSKKDGNNKSKRANSDSDSDFLTKKTKIRKKRNHSPNSSDSDKASKSKSSKKPNKRKRIKTPSNSDSSNSDKESNNQKRKNIRKLIKKKDLEDQTKKAAREEMERKRRIEERQKLYNRIYEKPESVELTNLVLDFDEETKEELLQVDKGLLKHLKPHQATGIKFMWDACFETLKDATTKAGSGCILAHCMGLGKTLQVIALAHTLIVNTEKTQVEKVLVITPLSTVSNWKREFHLWTKSCKNKQIEVYDMSLWRDNNTRVQKLREWHEEGGVCIMGYDMYRILANQSSARLKKKMKESLQKSLVDPGPDLVVCDEGHLLKNEKTSLSKAVSQMKTQRRIVLTGTPLQNNLKEYYCMIQFVKPNLLGTYKEYMNRFVNPITNGQYTDSTQRDIQLMKNRSHVLHKLLEGCIQRRDYSVLAPYLPTKHEYVVFLSLSDLQKKLYEFYMQTQKEIANAMGTKGAVLFQDFQNLRRIWTHPMTLRVNSDHAIKRKLAKELYNDSDDSINDFIDDNESTTTTESEAESESDTSGKSRDDIPLKPKRGTRRTRQNAASNEEESEPEPERKDDPSEWWKPLVPADELYNINHSYKLLLLMQIVEDSESIGDKVLLFSQSLQSLDVIEHFLSLIARKTDGEEFEGNVNDFTGTWIQGVDYFRLDGSTNVEARDQMVKVFNDETNHRARLFLISTRAGGLGINLVAANRVVIFDVSWNPSHDTQSIFRIYRFGQKKPCYIYRFIALGTMEEKVYDRQVAKQATAKRVIDEQQIGRHYNQSDLLELYTYELTPKDPRPIPALPKDRLFADLLAKYEKVIYKYHEHDSLLENEESEILNEDERKAAWAEYEAEKNRPLTMQYARPQYGQFNNGPVTSSKMYGLRIDVLLKLLNMKINKDYPHMTEAQSIQMVPIMLQQLHAEMNIGNTTLFNELIDLFSALEHPQAFYANQMMPQQYVNVNTQGNPSNLRLNPFAYANPTQPQIQPTPQPTDAPQEYFQIE